MCADVNIKDHWEQVYASKSPTDVSWYQLEPSLSLELIRRSVSSSDASVIDVGGGASLLTDKLYEAGFRRLAVLDISANALRYGKNRMGQRAAEVEWIEADVRRFRAPRLFDVWHDRAVFHFLTINVDRDAYVDALKSGLAVGGYLVIAAFAIDGPTRCSGLDVVQYDAQKLSAELGANFRLVEQRSETHLTPAGKEQRFTYFRFFRSS